MQNVTAFSTEKDCDYSCNDNQASRFPRQILPNSAAQFVKFYEIPWHYYPQIPYIPWLVYVVVLTDNTSKYKEFIVICNTKTHYTPCSKKNQAPKLLAVTLSNLNRF